MGKLRWGNHFAYGTVQWQRCRRLVLERQADHQLADPYRPSQHSDAVDSGLLVFRIVHQPVRRFVRTDETGWCEHRLRSVHHGDESDGRRYPRHHRSARHRGLGWRGWIPNRHRQRGEQTNRHHGSLLRFNHDAWSWSGQNRKERHRTGDRKPMVGRADNQQHHQQAFGQPRP